MVIANVEAGFLTGIPTTLIADTAAPLLAVKTAVLEDPKVSLLCSGRKIVLYPFDSLGWTAVALLIATGCQLF